MSEPNFEKEYAPEIKVAFPLKYNRVLTEEKYEFGGHRHSEWELKIVLGGGLQTTSDDVVYKLSRGEVILVEPKVFHREVSDKADYIVLQFYADGLPQTGKSRVFGLSNEDFELVRTIKYYCEFFSGREEKVDPRSGCTVLDGEEIKYTLIKLIEVLLYGILRRKRELLEPPESRGSGVYNKAIVFMRKNLNKNLAISEIAKECGACPTVLKSIFSKYTGHGVMSHFTYMRMIEAKAMLKRGMTVCEVSSALGFSSQSYFSQCFKRECGMSPSRYALNA